MMNTFKYIQSTASNRNKKLLIAVALLLATSLGTMALKTDSKPVKPSEKELATKGK